MVNQASKIQRTPGASELLIRLNRQSRLLVALFLVFGILLPLTIMIAEAALVQVIPQCENSVAGGTQCSWVNGNMSGGHWQEGMAVPQRPLWENLQDMGKNPGNVYTFTWSQTWVHQGAQHGIDWLVSYNQAQTVHQVYGGAPLTLDVCNFGNASAQAVCNNLRTSGSSITIDVPDDPFISGSNSYTGSTQYRINEFEQRFGNRTVTVRADQPISGAALRVQHTLGDSTYTPITDEQDKTASTTQTLLRWTLVFTTNTTANNAMFEFASHLALSGNPYVDKLAWGYDSNYNGLGAGGVACGSCWHQKDWKLCNNYGDCKSESNDNQIPLNANAPFPIVSNARLFSGSPITSTDSVTITTSTGNDIIGTIRYFLCGDTTYPYTDTLQNGCTQRTDGAGFKVQSAEAVSLTVSNQGNTKRSLATSSGVRVDAAGHYCFLTVYEPSYPSGQSYFNYIPMSDTNGTSECFDYAGPTAVRLQSLQAQQTDDPLTLGGFPIIGLILGLLGVVASTAACKLRIPRN